MKSMPRVRKLTLSLPEAVAALDVSDGQDEEAHRDRDHHEIHVPS
jgi:hypothetical protein